MSGYDNNQGGYGQQGGYGGQHGGGYGGQQGGYGGQHGGGYGGQQGGGYGGQQGGYPPQGGPGYGQQGHQGGGGEASSYYQSGPQQGYGNQSHGGGPGGEDGERGLTGALAGGGAGAFAGNKFGGSKTATVVGGLIGAFAGHKGQDKVEDWRDDRKEKKEEEKRKEEEERRWEEERRRADERRREEESRRRSRSRSSSRHRHSRRHSRSRSRSRSRSGHRYEASRSGAGAHYAGGFSATSRDIRLEAHGDYELRAECRTPSGDYRSSSIRLNEFLTNDRGSFRWVSGGGGGGGESSYTVQQGDTLRNIAARYSHTSFDDIARHNNIANPDMIYPGQNLRIPGTGGGGGGRGNFGASARDVRLVDGGRRLEAELRNGGDWVRSSIVLDERITNDNGRLHLI